MLVSARARALSLSLSLSLSPNGVPEPVRLLRVACSFCVLQMTRTLVQELLDLVPSYVFDKSKDKSKV